MSTNTHTAPAGPGYRGLGLAGATSALVGLVTLALTSLAWSDSTGWWTAAGLFVIPFLVSLATLAGLAARSYPAVPSAPGRFRFALASGVIAAGVCATLLGAMFALASLAAGF